MNFLGWGHATMLQALLAERVGLDVSVSYPSPHCTITLATVIRTFIFVIASVHHSGVFLAVAGVSQFGAAGECTRLLGFDGHGCLLSGIAKACMGSPTQALILCYTIMALLFHDIHQELLFFICDNPQKVLKICRKRCIILI